MLENEIPTRREISSHSSVRSVAMPPVLRKVAFLSQWGGNILDIKYETRQTGDADIQIFS